MKCYGVTAKCGHVGRHNYTPQVFPVRAEDAREAAARVRNFPRVKHHHKDAILGVAQIDEDTYRELVREKYENNYFRCTCRQDQDRWCDLEILPEDEPEEEHRREVCENYYRKKKQIRHPKRYMTKYLPDDDRFIA